MASASCMWSRSQRVGQLDDPGRRVVVPVIGRTPVSVVGRGRAAHLGGGALGQPQQLVVGGREDGVRVPGRGPDRVVPGELDVDEGADRLGVADGGDAADGLAGVPRGRTPASRG